jgi:hypothetical protein
MIDLYSMLHYSSLSRIANSAERMLTIFKVCTESSKIDLMSHVHKILSVFASFRDF